MDKYSFATTHSAHLPFWSGAQHLRMRHPPPRPSSGVELASVEVLSAHARPAHVVLPVGSESPLRSWRCD